MCIYWDPDVGAYRIYVARYIRGLGWVEDTYLGSAKNIAELIRIMSMFNYVKVCGIDVGDAVARQRDVDAAPRRHADCDAVSQLVGAC